MIKNKIILSFLFIILFISCQTNNAKDERVQADNEQNVVDKNNIHSQGLKELKLFENKYEKTWKIKPKEFPLATVNLVKVFKIDCSGECFKSEFKKRKTGGTVISKEDFDELIVLLENPKSYNTSTAACFDPKFALVVYDEENIPVEFLSICMNCNSYRTYPGKVDVVFDNKHLHGFSTGTRVLLRKMFNKWDVDYYGFSEFWDNEADYKVYLNSKTKLK